MVVRKKKKGMKPGTKTLAYVRRMISSERWVDRLPPASTIAETLRVSNNTVRKSLRILEMQRIIENNGTLGFTIIPKRLSELYNINKQLYFLKMLGKNTMLGELLNKGAKILGNFIILTEGTDITAANAASGETIKTSLREIERTKRKPVTTDRMLGLSGKKLKAAREQYKRQKRITSLADLVIAHKRELGLNV